MRARARPLENEIWYAQYESLPRRKHREMAELRDGRDCGATPKRVMVGTIARKDATNGMATG